MNIFRPDEDVLPIVKHSVQLKTKYGKPHVIWMQLGISNEEAAVVARKADLAVVMNKCIMMEHIRLF